MEAGMSVKTAAVLGTMLFAISSASAQTQDPLSGYYVVHGCKLGLGLERPEPGLPVYQGVCLGVIATLSQLAFARALPKQHEFCPPETSTRDQMMMVVVKHIENHPETLHQAFTVLAITAFRAAFPCGATQQKRR
jgi:hypothetical protein